MDYPVYRKESQFMLSIKLYAEALGWKYYHPYDSRKSNPGFPDVTIVRESRLIFAELKIGKNKLSYYQKEWLVALKQVSNIEVYLWYPADWDNIEKILR